MFPDRRLIAIGLLALTSVSVSAAWQAVSSEPGKRIEIDRASVRKDDSGKTIALGRIVLEKPIVDAKTSSPYRIVQALNRYDCTVRTFSTLKRSYFKEEGELLREEDIKAPIDMPVRTGMLDDKLLRNVCRPKPGQDATLAASHTADKVNEAAGELRKANEALIQKELKHASMQTPVPEKTTPEPKAKVTAAVEPHTAAKEAPPLVTAHAVKKSRPPAKPLAHHMPEVEEAHAPAAAHVHAHWGYEGEYGPEQWGRMKPEYASCLNGKRQSPIDIRDGFRVDLEPIQFTYRPSQFRIIDNGHTIQVAVSGNRISLLGNSYELVQFHFHRPSEERVNGRTFDMVAHLVHKAEDGRLAVVAVLLEQGKEHPLIQTVWNNLPLEKNDYVTPPDLVIDPAQLLPQERGYYTYMGSLTTPPCTEGVLWLVMKQPQQISPEQLSIFSRLYRNNVRPIQPQFSRMIKESR